MLCGTINFPNDIVTALNTNALVIFAGAGVSMGLPANLPDFEKLAKSAAHGTNIEMEPEEAIDRYLGRLESRKVAIRERIVRQLLPPGHNPLHSSLVRFFKKPNEVRIVTTNFDHLFESASEEEWGECPKVFSAPALPLGDRFHGIVHVHGDISSLDSLVITDADFGRAYLTEGWARRFLVSVYQTYTVLFIGYSHEDTVLSYLARALPPSVKPRRYSLIKAVDDPDYWRFLGIEPIPFAPHEDDEFFNLDDGAKSLAEFRQRGVLDWSLEIKAITSLLHPLPQDKHDHLNHLLNELWAVKLFGKAVNSVDWLNWLDREGHLEQLFRIERLDDCGLEFARLLENEFVLQHPDALQLICARHKLQLNSLLWHNIARGLSIGQTLPANNVFTSWLALLIECKTDYRDPSMFAWLARRANDLELPWCIQDIFVAMTAPKLKLKSAIHPFELDVDAPPRVSMNLELHSDFGHLREVWTLMEPRLNSLAEPLIRSLIVLFEQRFRLEVYYGAPVSEWDHDSMSRSAIEPNAQDKYPRPLHAVIDALRDSLKFLSDNRPDEIPPLIRHLMQTGVPLLRRMAVHVVFESPIYSASDKLRWLLDKIKLDDIACHHEIFRLLAGSFANADEGSRDAIVLAISNLQLNDKDMERPDEHVERIQFSLLNWLNLHAPGCASVVTSLTAILGRHPTWKTRQHADFNHYSSGGRVQHKSPWSKEQLLSKSAGEWLADMLTCQTKNVWEDGDGDSVVEVGREGLWVAIRQASEDNPHWGVDLGQSLSKNAEWASDLWYGLFESWEKWIGNESATDAVFAILLQDALLMAHPQRISRLLRSFIDALQKNNSSHLASHFLRANQVSFMLWTQLARDVPMENPEGDWVHFAINRPAGYLVEFWIHGHSYLQKVESKELSAPNYIEAFERVMVDESLVGGAGRTILFRYISYLHVSLPTWTLERLVPLLSTKAPSIFRQAWHGLLTGTTVGPALWNAIHPHMLQSSTRVNLLTGPDTEERTMNDYPCLFTDLFVDCMTIFVANPSEVWIPTLFKNSTEEIHIRFASRVEKNLEEMNEEERRLIWAGWLKNHWENRLQGVPSVLSAKEAGAMFTWMVHLECVYADAVELAIRTHDFNLEYTHLFYDLVKSEIPVLHTEDTARLLVHILQRYVESREYEIYDLSPLLQAILPQLPAGAIRSDLHGYVIQAGMVWPDGA